MNALEERILEIALRETLGAERPPDLRLRIRAALRPRARWPWLALAAAALLVAAVMLRPTTKPARPAPEPRLAELLADLRVGAADIEQVGIARFKEAQQARRHLRVYLAARPEAWEVARAQLFDWPADPARRDVKRGLVEVLLLDPDPATRARLLAELETDPAAFGDDALLFLDARARLRERAREQGVGRVLPAAHLALRGDATGAATLRWLCGERATARSNLRLWLAAAAGLRELGEPAQWTEASSYVRRLAERSLSRDELDFAVTLVAQWEHFAAERPPLAFLKEALERRTEEERARLTDAAKVRERLERLGG